MELVKHETCEGYIARRLSEGWGIVWQTGYLILLSSPDGNILRPVDLRNDIETLRPNASGAECNITSEVGCSACPDHFDCVDEAAPDGNTTQIWPDFPSPYDAWYRDLYNIDNSSGAGTINHIKVYANCKRSNNGSPSHNARLKIAIKSGATTDESGVKALTTSWASYNEQWNTNPDDAAAWEWADIDSLQIGVALELVGPNAKNFSLGRCTQVYVEVDYTPAAAGSEGKTAAMAAKMIAGKLI